MNMHNGLNFGMGFVDTRVDLHLGALGQPLATADLESFGVAQDHIVRFHNRQRIELVLAPFDKK